MQKAKQTDLNAVLDESLGSMLREDDAFFLLRLLEHLPTEAERNRLVSIAEQIAKNANQ